MIRRRPTGLSAAAEWVETLNDAVERDRMQGRERHEMTPPGSLFTRLGILLAAVALIVAACGDDDGPAITTAPPGTTVAPVTSAAPPGPETHTVEIGEFFFEPVDLTVSIGDTVTWRQQGNLPHTTTAGTPGAQSGEWDSGTMNAGDSFSTTFDAAGTFQYFCTIHPNQMQATITVTEG